MGIPAGDRAWFRQWTANAVPENGPRAGGGPAGAPVPVPGDYLRVLVAAKRRRPGGDLVSTLITAAERDQLSEAELLSMVFLLLLAGHRTLTTKTDHNGTRREPIPAEASVAQPQVSDCPGQPWRVLYTEGH